jgi:hypothetical protein
MKKLLLILAALSFYAFVATGCSTMGQFKIPAGTTLKVTDREVSSNKGDEGWSTSPFFWNVASGAPYELVDASGKVIRSGKLKTHFRVVSIFWPPGAIIYWPMGFMKGEYDLTAPADGVLVTDDKSSSAASFKAAPSKKKAKAKTSDE